MPSPEPAAPTAKPDYGVHWKFSQTPTDLSAGAEISPRQRGGLLNLPRRHRPGKRAKDSEAYRHWAVFMALGGLTLVENRKGAGSVHVVKRLHPANLMVPADGTVLPVSSIASTQVLI
ncbi:MAG: hypothetical protein HKL95_05160 [Phycisphaerae bacterium]|nr:hypothetical protein [Phycisphaerae bacterium]